MTILLSPALQGDGPPVESIEEFKVTVRFGQVPDSEYELRKVMRFIEQSVSRRMKNRGLKETFISI